MTTPLVEVSVAHKRAVVPYRAEIASLVPQAVRTVWKGQDSLVIPHEPDAVRLARNVGINVPPPIYTRYNWPHPAGQPPFAAQKGTAALLSMHQGAYVLNDMGTGKTRAALWAFDFMRSEGRARRMLVTAPLSTLERTWGREVFTTTPHLTVRILHGDKAKRLRRLADDADIYIINHDGIGIILDELMKRQDIDVLCIDELAVFRNGNSQRNKTMQKLARSKPIVWGMTGRPTPNGPTDAYGQVKIVTPQNMPVPFRLWKDQTMLRVSEFKWIAKPDSQDRVHRVMQPSVRYTMDDVAELPELVMRQIDVPMGTKQKALYDHLRKHLHALWEQKEITVANAGVLMGKLLQIATGWVYDRERGIVSLDNDARLQTLDDIVESASHKVIVFVPFIHALDGIAKFLEAQGHTVATVSGETSAGNRGRIFTDFQTMENPRVLVAHPACMAHGLTLTAADTIVWFGPYPNLEIFDQANARITRVGQKHRQQVLMLTGTPVEAQLYKRLQDKQKVQDTLLDMFERQDSGV